QKLQPLRLQCRGNERHASGVAAGPGETLDETGRDWIAASYEDDRNSVSRSLCRTRRHVATTRDDDGHLVADKIGRERWQLIELPLGEAILDGHIAAFHVAAFAQAL